MSYSFKFSIIIAFNNAEETLDKTISSVINQSMDFTENVQLILVDMKSTDKSYEIAQEYYKQYPVNITIIKQDYDLTSAYNTALSYCEGKYSSIISQDDYISLNTLDEVYTLFDENDNIIDLISIPINYIGQNQNNPLNYKYQKTQVIDLNHNPNNPQISLYSTFIKTDILKNLNIEDYTQSTLIINKILLDKKSYGIIENATYFQNKNHEQKEDYILRLHKLDEKLISDTIRYYGYLPEFIQYTIIYELSEIIQNTNTSNDELTSLLIKILYNIDDNILQENNKISYKLRSYLLYLKNNKEAEINNTQSTLTLESNGNLLEDIKDIPLKIDEITIQENNIQIKATYESILDNINIKLCNDNVKHEVVKVDKEIKKYLDDNWIHIQKLEFNIELEDIENKITFNINYDDKNLVYTPQIILESTKTTKIYKYNNEKIIIFTDNTSIQTMKYYKNIREYYKFTIIMAIYNTENYLSDAIDSVINQTLNFKENIQLILVNDGSTDKSIQIIEEYQRQYPENILAITTQHKGQSNARNIGLKYARGEYINFLDSDDYISQDTLEEIYNYFEEVKNEVDLVSIPIKYTDSSTAYHKLHYKYSKTRIIDLINHPNYPQLSVSASFFKYSTIKNLEFDTKLKYSEDALFVNKILFDKKQYAVLNNVTYYQRKRYTEDALTDTRENDKNYYIPRLKRFHQELINYSQDIEHTNKTPKFIQYLLAYDIQELLQVYDIDLLETQEDKEEFNILLYDIISHIDKKVIMNNRNVDAKIKKYFIYLKNNKQKKYTQNNKNEIQLKTSNILIDTFQRHKLGLDIIDIKKGKLYISGYVTSHFSEDETLIKIIKEDKKSHEKEIIDCQYVNYSQKDRRTEKHLSTPWKYSHSFDAIIPLDEKDYTLKFVITLKNNEINTSYEPEIAFRLPSGLSTTGIYMTEENKIIYFQQNMLHLIKYSYLKMIRLEASINKKIIHDKKDGYKESIKLRLIHLLLYPYMKNKQVWLFNDRPLLADDNAKHLFKYSQKQKDGIKKYYVLKRESKDWNDMKQISNNIIEFGSFKHKLLYLFSNKHISAFVNDEYRNPFYTPGGFDHRRLYSGLANNKRYFLQHGITLGNVTRSLKRYNTNLSLVVCSANKEQESFLEADYNYDKNIFQLLGFPRYDNLTTDNTKKQIVFMPTWRAPLSHSQKAFYNSDFYHSLINFINNKEMLEKLEELGYQFVFKPHPELTKYLDTMPINDKIIISQNDSYQELFRDSSILITDYSSVAFDFAYLKKPVIYYQPNDDYPYEKGYFEFESMGFGEVITQEKQIVEKILEYIKTGCLMEDKYKQRVNEFFEYTDKNNCKRVYEWIKND